MTTTAQKTIALTVTPNDGFWKRAPSGKLKDKVEYLLTVLSGYFARMGKGYLLKGCFELGASLRLHFHATVKFKTERAYYSFIKSVSGSLAYNVGFVVIKPNPDDKWTKDYLDKEAEMMMNLGVAPLSESSFYERYVIKQKKSSPPPVVPVPIRCPIIDWARQLIIAAARPPNTYIEGENES